MERIVIHLPPLERTHSASRKEIKSPISSKIGCNACMEASSCNCTSGSSTCAIANWARTSLIYSIIIELYRWYRFHRILANFHMVPTGGALILMSIPFVRSLLIFCSARHEVGSKRTSRSVNASNSSQAWRMKKCKYQLILICCFCWTPRVLN